MAQRLGGRGGRKAIILLYHRINEAEADPWGLCVTPGHFDEHLEVLRKHGQILPLRQLVEALREGTLPRRSFAVTFDDGYYDNLKTARPLLERHEIPATVFITSGMLGCKGEFWWDELERIFLQPHTLPETLRLSIDGEKHEWELDETAQSCKMIRLRGWRAWENPPASRHFLYQTVWKLLQRASERQRQAAVEDLYAWAGLEPGGRESHRTLSPQEAVSLAKGGLVEIGAHTVTHLALAAVPAELQRFEIQQSKTQLEEILNMRIASFSYPYGQSGDYSSETVRVVQEAGFSCACASHGGLVLLSSELFQLPRLHVEDMDGERFDQWLEWQFRG